MTFSEFYSITFPQSDKGIEHDYIDGWYTEEFTPIRNNNLTIVEIGIQRGYSLNLFKQWFTNSKIIGIDNGDEVRDDYYEFINSIDGVEIIWDDAYNKSIVDKFEDNSIDYVIDDGPHWTESQLDCVRLWYSKLKPGGKIIIEDIQSFDSVKHLFIELSNELNIQMDIIDLRINKGRFDDILIIFKK